MTNERDGADSAMEEAARLSLELEAAERYAEKLLGVIQCCNANTKRRDAKLKQVREWALSEYDATKAPSKDFTLGYLSAGMQVLAILDGADALAEYNAPVEEETSDE